MGKSKKELYAKLQALKDELPRREIIAALLDAEGFNLAVSEYKEKFKEAVDAEDKKEISVCKKNIRFTYRFSRLFVPTTGTC